jgi:hypothetical protein
VREEDKRYQDLAGERLQRALALIEKFRVTMNSDNMILEGVDWLDSDEDTVEEEYDVDMDQFENFFE